VTTQTPDLEQAEPTPTAPKAEKVRRPGWKKPEAEQQEPSPSLSLDPGSLDAATDGGSDAGPDSVGPNEQMPDDRPRSGGSSRTSSPVEREALRNAVRVGFASVTTGAHELLVRDPYAKYAEVLLADEQDLDAIAEPGGNLLARRMPKDAPLGGELGDLIALGIGLAGYLLKQVGRIRYARQLRDNGAVLAGGEFQPEAAPQQPDEPAGPDFPLVG